MKGYCAEQGKRKDLYGFLPQQIEGLLTYARNRTTE